MHFTNYAKDFVLNNDNSKLTGVPFSRYDSPRTALHILYTYCQLSVNSTAADTSSNSLWNVPELVSFRYVCLQLFWHFDFSLPMWARIHPYTSTLSVYAGIQRAKVRWDSTSYHIYNTIYCIYINTTFAYMVCWSLYVVNEYRRTQ